MRYAILSDIHASLEGLKQVLLTLRNDNKIDVYYCSGDIGGCGVNFNGRLHYGRTINDRD